MDFDFEKEIVLENDRALLRPLLLTDVGHLLPVATEDKDLIRFSPSAIHSPELLTEYVGKMQSETGLNK